MKTHIKENTKVRLSKLGNITQDYEDVILQLIEHAEVCDRFWSDK